MIKRYFLFRLLGFPLYMETTFLFLLGIYVLSGGLSPAALLATFVFVVAAVLSVTWHELGHALIARQLGAGSISIVLHGAGGLTYHGPLRTVQREMAVSAAGPAAGLLLGLAFWFVRNQLGVPGPALLADFVDQMIFINVGWSLFNLVPMQPLDGGHLFHGLLRLRLPVRQAQEVSWALSFYLAVGLGLLAVLHRWIFVALICLFSGQMAWTQMGGAGPLRRLWRNVRG